MVNKKETFPAFESIRYEFSYKGSHFCAISVVIPGWYLDPTGRNGHILETMIMMWVMRLLNNDTWSLLGLVVLCLAVRENMHWGKGPEPTSLSLPFKVLNMATKLFWERNYELKTKPNVGVLRTSNPCPQLWLHILSLAIGSIFFAPLSFFLDTRPRLTL